MTINKMKALKVGDVVVQVRSHYQNYDHKKAREAENKRVKEEDKQRKAV